MRRFRFAIAAIAAALTFGSAEMSPPAFANVLTEGTGWQQDEIPPGGGTSSGSPWTFTVIAGQKDIFSLVDGHLIGDVYTVSGDALANSVFALPTINIPLGLGDAADFDSPWTDPAYSHLQLTFGPGAYSLSIAETDGNLCSAHDPAICFPAGFGVRLDAVSSVPGPIVGSGLPSLIFASASLLAWCRKKRRDRALGKPTGHSSPLKRWNS